MQIPFLLVVLTLLIVFGLVGFVAWKKYSWPLSGKEPPVLSGKVIREHVSFEFIVCLLPSSDKDPLSVFEALLENQYFDFEKVDEIIAEPERAIILPTKFDGNTNPFTPPDLGYIKLFGRGVSEDQAAELQRSNRALALMFFHPRHEVFKALKAANSMVYDIAAECDGLIIDNEARQIFTPDEWRKTRIEDWREQFPDVSNHMTMHAYQDGEYIRTITLGMAKFGLPDVVINQTSRSHGIQVGNLINLFCQCMVEGAEFELEGDYILNVLRIKNRAMRKALKEYLIRNATARANIVLRKGKWEEGDPDNGIVEICFDRYSGKDPQAKQEALFSELFGWEDSLFNVAHEGELEAASQRAKEKLSEVRAKFQNDMKPGDLIMVKAPFNDRDGGHEWMWVEVIRWEENDIQGLLRNQPFHVPDLQAGQRVEVNQDDIFDYLIQYRDGTQEGNETSEIIERNSKYTERQK